MRYCLPALILFSVMWLASCGEPPTQVPRKHGFHRIEIPAQTKHQQFQSNSCPFTFEYPDFGEISRNPADSCWVNISFERYGLTWHFNYRQAGEMGMSRSEHFEEHRRLVYKHAKKASQIKPQPIEGPNGKGVLYEVYGNVGTPAYVFYADTAGQDMFMMSFYFQTALENDSLAPIIEYMKGEVSHTIETLEWK